MAAVLDEITISTEAMYPDLNMSVLSRQSAFTRELQDSAVTDEDGSPIEVRVRYKRNPGFAYGGYDVLPTDPEEQFAKGSLQWRNLGVSVTVDEDTLVENASLNIKDLLSLTSIKDLPARGRKTIFNLFGKKMAGAIEDFQELFANVMWGNTVGPKFPHSIQTIIDNAGSYAGMSVSELQTFDYLGILSGVYDNIWSCRNYNAANAPFQLDFVGSACDDASRGGADRVSRVYMPLAIYQNAELQLEGQKVRDDKLANIGFQDNVRWTSKGITFVADDFCPANTIYGVDTCPTSLKLRESLSIAA